MVYQSLNFFLFLAIAVTFEDLVTVTYIARRLLRQGGIEFKLEGADKSCATVAVRIIGNCWVALWFSMFGVASMDRRTQRHRGRPRRWGTYHPVFIRYIYPHICSVTCVKGHASANISL